MCGCSRFPIRNPQNGQLIGHEKNCVHARDILILSKLDQSKFHRCVQGTHSSVLVADYNSSGSNIEQKTPHGMCHEKPLRLCIHFLAKAAISTLCPALTISQMRANITVRQQRSSSIVSLSLHLASLEPKAAHTASWHETRRERQC